MELKYHLAQDTIDADEVEKLAEWLRGNPRLTQGDLTFEFERKWSDFIGRKYSIFCNSGSSANLLMYYTLLISGKLRNKKVIVPSAGWVTSITPAIQFGFEPIMCEADSDTFGLDIVHLETLLKQHDPAVVCLVQMLGVPHKMDALMTLKKQYNFYLLEDACAATGATYNKSKVGMFGDISSFSLYFGHQLSTIEGGMVCTDDKELHHLLLMLRSHGWGKDLPEKIQEQMLGKYSIDNLHDQFVFYEPGFNLRSTDLNAFLGINQLKKASWMATQRGKNHSLYKKLLGNRFRTQNYGNNVNVCSIHFCALARNTNERRTIVRALEDNGIETRIFTAGNLGRHPFWFNRYGIFHAPTADMLYETGFFLPNHPSLTSEDVSIISDVVLQAVHYVPSSI